MSTTADRNAVTSDGVKTTVHLGSGFAPPTPSELAARFPSIEVLELLGHGGMGLVYRARQPLLDRTVAIKIIRPDMEADANFQARFLSEARALARLRHPYIVTIFDVYRSEELYCLVMEFVEGSNLRQRLSAGSLSERDVLDMLPQITEALQHAHDAGVVHRDVKPENVLVDARGRVRLVDFGLATLVGPGLAGRGPNDDRVAGTLCYMAPEQITMPQTVDHRADIYSTGVVLYEMLTRELPGSDRLPPSRKGTSNPQFDPIVLRAIEHDRDRRYQQAMQMHDDITSLARTPESTIRILKHIPALPAQVFEVWVTPDQMADWYAPSDDFGPTIGEVDLHVGGHYRVGMLLPGQSEPKFVSGDYCRIDPPRTLSFTWGWEPHQAGWPETQVTLEFHARDNGTDLVLTHERFRSEKDKNDHTQGWQGCLNRLSRKFGGV